jgi:hypothetical protein
MTRQLFDLGDAVAILEPDEEGSAAVCILARGQNEVWIFGKHNISVLGAVALAAQRFIEPPPGDVPPDQKI